MMLYTVKTIKGFLARKLMSLWHDIPMTDYVIVDQNNSQC